MNAMPARRSAGVWCVVALLMTIGASSCDKDQSAGPNDYRPKTPKKTNPVPCDNEVVVDALNGPQPDPVYLCDGDDLTWKKGKGTNTFSIHFTDGSPFEDNATDFDDQKPTHKAKKSYDALYAYEYEVVVNLTKHFDPQVVTGGNP
jgi:hypothetical protein